MKECVRPIHRRIKVKRSNDHGSVPNVHNTIMSHINNIVQNLTIFLSIFNRQLLNGYKVICSHQNALTSCIGSFPRQQMKKVFL